VLFDPAAVAADTDFTATITVTTNGGDLTIDVLGTATP